MRVGLRLVRVLQVVLFAVVITGIASSPAADAVTCSEMWATATPSEGPAPLTVEFSASSGGAQCCQPFGDGQTCWPAYYWWFPGTGHDWDNGIEQQNLTLTYSKPGTYTWMLSITLPTKNEWGQCTESCSFGGYINVTAALPPSISKGGPQDYPHTVFEEGRGAGACGGKMPVYWVNTSNLNLYIEDTVFSSQGVGPGIGMTHNYNADPNQSGMFGKGWSFSYDSSITQTCTDATLTRGSGASFKYKASLCSGGAPAAPPVEATPPEGHYDRLTWYGDYWLLVEKTTFWTYRYDKDPDTSRYLLSSITDANGNAVQITCNADKTIQKITDAAGRATSFSYDVNKRCTGMTTPDGRQATYQYDANGRLATTVDLAGYVSNYDYDAEGYLVGMNATGLTTQFTYSTTGGWKHVASVTDGRGNKKLYEAASASPRKIKMTDPEGGVTFYASSNELTGSVTDPLNHTMTTTYSKGEPVAVTDFNGGVTNREYDSRGNLTKFTDTLGNVTTYAYDANDNLFGKTNALNQTWTFKYDERHNLIEIASPLGNKSSMAYDTKGQLITVTDPLGKTASFTHDSFGNVLTQTDPLGNTTTMTYDAYGFTQTSIKDARGNTTTFEYDDNQRLTKEIYPDGSFKTFTYDCCARQSTTDENGHTETYTRDALLYITQVTDALGNVTARTYDKNSNLIGLTNALGKTVSISYDAAHRPVLKTNPMGGVTESSYDANGNLTKVKDERANETQFVYDANNRPTSSTDPLGNRVTNEWDALGRLFKRTNARGGAVTYTHDADGRPTEKAYDGVAAANYGYDAAGNLTEVTDFAGETSFSFDANRRPLSVTYPDGRGVSFSYDQVGHVSSITYPGGLSVNYSYNNRNRLSGVTWGANSMTFTYDAAGNLINETRSNGTKSTYSYDTNNRVLEIKHAKGTTPFAHMAYTRNALGNTIQETPVVPLSPSITATSVAATYNDGDQIATRGANIYSYDVDGNLINATGSTGSLFTHTYDHENRLVSSNLKGAVTSYAYNGLGQRTRVATSSQTRNYHYGLNGRLLFETDGDGQLTVCYIYAGAHVVALGNPSGGYSFYHFDKTGNAVALTDGAGNVIAAYAYLPFGLVTNRSGSIYNPFTFVGAYGVMEDANGQHLMQNRYYGSGTGRFFQKDSAVLAGGANPYTYAHNNPRDYIDPQGLWEWPDWTLSQYHSLDRPIEWATDVSAGFGDSLIIPWVVNKITGADAYVNKSSSAYKRSWWGGFAFNCAMGGVGSLNAGADAVFYGGAGALEAAQGLKGTGTILAETLGGRLLNAINNQIYEVPDAVWRVASAIYAANAKGSVKFFVGEATRPNPILQSVEIPLLKWLGNTTLPSWL